MLITTTNRYGVEDGDQYPVCKSLTDCHIFEDELDSDGERIVDTWAYWDCGYDEAPYLREFSNEWGQTDEMGGTWPRFWEDVEELYWS